MANIIDQLQEPFDPLSDIEWRVQQTGKDRQGRPWASVLAYITNRAIMERLDSVFGIGGWQNEYIPLPDGGIICGIKCKIEENWIIKYDGADKSAIEPTKGGLSNAMKRAAVQWGMGRYLYRLQTTFVNLKPGRPENDDQIHAYIKEFTKGAKDGGHFHYDRPRLPSFAIPKGDK